MDEAEDCSGEFRGFDAKERDDKLKALCGIINTPLLSEFNCSMVLKDFEQFWAPRLGRPACEPYFFPFQVVCSGVPVDLLARGINERCELFFDENVIFGPRAKAWYPVLRASFPPEVIAVMPVEPWFRSDEEILPLQAADLTAWMQRHANENGLGDFEWLWDKLSLIHRSPISQVVDTAWIMKMARHKQTPEEFARNKAVRDSYREIFGHEWPPRTKIEKRRHTGRLK
jgi:hypothetical protein